MSDSFLITSAVAAFEKHGFRFFEDDPRIGWRRGTHYGYGHVFVVRLRERSPASSVGARCYAFWDFGTSHDQQEMVYTFNTETLVNDALGFFREYAAWTE